MISHLLKLIAIAHILNGVAAFSFSRISFIPLTSKKISRGAIAVDSQYSLDFSETISRAWDSYNQALTDEPLLTK